MYVTREEQFLGAIIDGTDAPTPVTRIEIYLKAIADQTEDVPDPVTRIEKYLYAIVMGTTDVPDPVTRIEHYLYAIATDGNEVPDPVTRVEQLWNIIFEQGIAPFDIENTAPYLFRAVPDGVGNKMKLNAVVGGTVAWNQLVNTDTETVTVVSGHKYLARINGTASVGISDGTAISVTGGTDNVHDVTQMFGTTIADYVYTLESATAGSGIAWLKSYGFFTKDYYPYSAPTLQSVKTSAHETVGFNALAEQPVNGSRWVSGVYKSTGYSYNASSPSKIRCVPNATYCISLQNELSANIYAYCVEFDSDENFLRDRTGVAITNANKKITYTPNADVGYFAIYFYRSGGMSESEIENCCVNLSWDGERDGEYEAYKKRTYPLDTSLELRGVPKLDSSNKLYYDGDTYEADGTVTRKYGIVDLGTLTWTLDSRYTNTQFYSALSDAKSSPDGNMICAKYSDVARGVWGDNVDKTICVTRGTPYVLVVDSSYPDATSFKTAMDGVYLVYELAEPTTESAEPYTKTQSIDPYGTEEFVDTRDVPVPVGHESAYKEI